MTATGQAELMTDAQLIDAYLADLTLDGRPESTITTYGQILHLARRQLPYGILASRAEIRTWLATRDAPATRATYRAALCGLYRWAVAAGHLDVDPSAALPTIRVRRGLPRPAADHEVVLILTTAPQPVRLWSTLAALAGARCVEIARLRREDITAERLYVRGKGSRERVIPTHPDLWEAVRGLPAGLIAGGATRRQVSQRMAAAYRRLGLATRPHQLRHWFATTLIEAGASTRVAQQLLGHERVSTTEVYTRVSGAALTRAVLTLPRVAGAAGLPAAPDPGCPPAP